MPFRPSSTRQSSGRARAYEQSHGAPAQARLPTANIVVAEPMPGGKGLFEKFVADQPEVVRNVWRLVWDLLALAAETDSLPPRLLLPCPGPG
ncbi:MAG: hypothetical protein QHJ81_03665 [Anaerolineae bacterium]|nr:hypothetical protein [Anaerolineae bacterium]